MRRFPRALSCLAPLALLASLASARSASAEVATSTRGDAPLVDAPTAAAARGTSDYLFPGHGKLSASLSTGIPFVEMSELAVGIGDRFAIGALAGIALSGDDGPRNTGFGLRPRLVLVRFDSTRITAVAPTLYYPIAKGSWVLTRPSFAIEHRFANGAYLGGGLGFVLVSSVDTLVGRAHVDGALLPYGGVRGRTGSGAANGIWNTTSVHGALPVTEHTSAFFEGALIMNGLALANDAWIGAVPFTLTLGVTTQL